MKLSIKISIITLFCCCTIFVANGQPKVKWTNFAGYVTVSNDTLKKYYNRTNWCDGAESKNVLKSGTNGWVAYKINQTNSNRVLGFQSGGSGSCWGTTGWGLYLNSNGRLLEVINTTTMKMLAYYAAGDSIKIERKGNKILYKKNNVQLDSTTVSNNVDLYVDAMFYNYLGAFENVVASFDVLNITSTTPGSRCGTGTDTLGAVASGGTINWYAASTGGTSLGTGASFVTPSISTTTNYYVSTTSDHGYTSTPRVSVTATVNTIPTVTLSASPSTICNGASSTLTAGGATSYSWSGGLGTGNPKTVAPTTTTEYTVTGTDGNGCSNTASITITVNPIPSVTLNAAPSTICNGSSTTLTATGATTYSWSGGLPGSGNTQIVSPTTTTIYTVTGTTSGCSNTASVTLTHIAAKAAILSTKPTKNP